MWRSEMKAFDLFRIAAVLSVVSCSPLAGPCAAQGVLLPAEASRISAFLSTNREALDLSDGAARFEARLLDAARKQVTLLGETHGIAVNEDLDLALLRYLHRVAGVRVYLAEGGYAASCLLNRYLETGDEQILDFVMQAGFGSISWTKEQRAFYVALRRWNLTLPEDARVRLVGIDLEHQQMVAVRYLAQLAQPQGRRLVPPGIAGTIASLERMAQSASDQSDKQFVGALAANLASHRAEYAEWLGDALFDFELATGNLQKTLDFYAAPREPRTPLSCGNAPCTRTF